MVLSDLDQIKKNERDRRRRLRLEQVRQQSKEISSRLLERAKKIAREECNKLEKDGKSELRQMHDRKIMEIQQKYQEDLEDIGQAHASAASQPDIDVIIEEEARKDRAVALKRGKDAMQRLKEAKQKDSLEITHHERLHKVREMEDTRAAMIAKIPKSLTSEEKSQIQVTQETNSSQESTSEEICHMKSTEKKKKGKKVLSKKSPRTKKSNLKEYQKTLSPKPGPSGLQKQPHKVSGKKANDVNGIPLIEHITDNADDQSPRKTVPVISTMPTKKVRRYNPQDYTLDMSDSSNISNSSSSSISDDSSYFSDSAEQVICNKTPRMVPSTDRKVRLYDHDTRQRKVYDRPLGMVERVDIENEPNAMEAAQAMKDVEDAKTHISKIHKLNAERRGEDAILREKVRRDYQDLMQSLDHLAQEERKLKASQIPSNAEEDTYMRLHQRNKCQEEHERKLNRATKNVLNMDGAPTQYSHLTERVITLPTQKKICVNKDVPHSTWLEPRLAKEKPGACCMRQDEDSEVSHEEEILEMLKKVERQKRLLLQKFGASLPNDIFNASIKPLFEDRAPPQIAETRTLSPEIKVINMSSCGECRKKERSKTKKQDKSPTKKTEIAVQTVKIRPAQDKSVQVELPRENADTPRPSEDTTARVPHPIEPKVTVITPETDDSSNDSTNSEITGMIIEIDKKEVTVTPKRRRSGLKVSKRSSPRVYQKIRSTVSSKSTSPMKRFSRSQSSSRLTSPQKKTRCTDVPDTASSRRVDIHVSESAFNDETDPSQETRMSIDASAESSQTLSGANDQNQSSGKPYRVQTQMKKWIRIKDTSDTSTSFASPPPAKPKSMLDALSNITPILELLDSSRIEEFRRLRQDISPVSTPETPSPRTMRMPSNIPHIDKISRMLRFNSIASQTNGNDILSSTQKDQFTSTDPSNAYSQRRETSGYQPTPSQQLPKVCACKNPTCKLLHTKLEDIHDYALKNCPEILQKYENLQHLCMERIASLTSLIERVRNEQKDIDLSLISPSDETSLMQLPASKPSQHNDLQAMCKLVEDIEAVHAQLAKTLIESQKITGREAVPEEESSRDAKIQASTSTPKSKSVDNTVTTHTQESETVEGKAKPKIISDKRVNLQLNRFKTQQKTQAPTPIRKIPDRNSWQTRTVPLHSEEVIEKLSREILRQTNSLDKTGSAFISLKRSDESSTQHKASPSKEANLTNNTSSEHEKNSRLTRENVQEETKENFIPILAGIPKVLRTHGSVTMINGRPKPPITLLNAPYWQELESSGHELSTIIEFDTTDTVNKSPMKSKSISVNATEETQKIWLKRTGDMDPLKSAIVVKPSVHVAPLPVQNQESIEKTTDSVVKHSAEKLTSSQRMQETTTVCSSPEKLKNTATGCIEAAKTEAEQVSVDCTFEKCNKQLQCNATAEEPAFQAKDRLDSFISTDFNNQHKNSQHQTTSSLNSISGLSGISEITSSPSSDFFKYASSPEEMEIALKKLGLGWAVTTLKKTREASALSSSSNSDVTPVNTARRMISPTKKFLDPSGLPDISDVSSISIKEASKSTEQVVLMKGRTSTPKIPNSNSNSERSTTTNMSESLQEPSDSLTVPNVSLTKTKSDNKQLQSP